MPGQAKILLVDDRAENITALEATLASLNQTLIAARSGEEALKALLSDEFAVILLDVLMPGMDGFETAAHIKRRAKTRDVPIIFLTALNSEPDYAFRSYSAGGVDYIAKPFDPWVLRAKVSVLVELYLKNRRLTEQAARLRAQLAVRPAGPGAFEPGLSEVSQQLAAVEDLVMVITGQIEGAAYPAISGPIAQLDDRVAKLRGTVDGLRASADRGSARDKPAGHSVPLSAVRSDVSDG